MGLRVSRAKYCRGCGVRKRKVRTVAANEAWQGRGRAALAGGRWPARWGRLWTFGGDDCPKAKRVGLVADRFIHSFIYCGPLWARPWTGPSQ